jgi:hypothetical protein
MGYLSTFWAFGYSRLAAKLRKGIADPSVTPPRAEVPHHTTPTHCPSHESTVLRSSSNMEPMWHV